MTKLTTRERKQLETWAHRAIHGLDHSQVFVGILDDHPLDAARAEFTLQLGHAILTDKWIVIPVPFGVEIPTKLRHVADRVVRYDPSRMESLTEALVVALTELGVNQQ